MDFSFTREQLTLRDTLKRFVKEHFPREVVRSYEKSEEPPVKEWKAFSNLGFCSLGFPEEYGGTGGNIVEQAIICEELGRAFASMALMYGLGVCFGGITILKHGTEEQKKQYLPPIISGDLFVCLGMTEPAGGTDILGVLKTRAVRDGNKYIINGQKVFTTGAHISEYILVVARTNMQPAKKSSGLTLFLVKTNSPGIELRKIEKLGSKSMSSFEVFLKDVSVDESSILGELDCGWYHILDTLNHERVAIAALSVGIAQAAFDDALEYAKERHAFGQPIGHFQTIQGYLSTMATDIELARLITYKAAWLHSCSKECSMETSMAKMFASDCAVKVTDLGMRIMAGYGFTMEYDMQRYFRDARQYVFAPITNEMTKNIIAQLHGLPKSY